MKDKCVNCEKDYHPKDDFCRRCVFEEAKWKFIYALTQTKVALLMYRFVDWLSRKLRKGGVE